jgi:D-alanyl-D-alanine carboxypeptidase/D-alanyl-D-alanine-endopeptidase (penicillin-binding protein 4)
LSKRFRQLLLLFALSAFLVPTFVPESRAGTLRTIQATIAKFLKRPGARSASWGIQVVDPATSEVLLEVNADKPFLPASVLKMVTTATAVEKLGPEFRYRTGVYTNGVIEPGGILSGDLIIVGRGDPNLTDPFGETSEKPAFQELAETIQSLGITGIRGDVIGDESYFAAGGGGKGWTAYDLRSVYGAPINALSINNNVFTIEARPTKRKQRVSVTVHPRASCYNIRNLAVTGSARAKKSINARLIRASKTIVISGVLPASRVHTQHIVLEAPSEVAASMLKGELLKLGILSEGKTGVFVCGDVSKDERLGWILLAEHQSPPLIRALEIINKRSQNLHAEMLLRTLGAEFKGEGSNEAGLQVVKEFLADAGIDNDRIRLDDGCGLSRENLLTPRFQTSLLEYLFRRPYFDLFLGTLAVSGTDGTLKNRLSTLQVRGSIHAKTGTLNGVTTLAGYMTTRSGRNLVFSIFANRAYAERRVRKTIDEICSLFVSLY